MAMSDTEKLLLEAVKNLLSGKAKLGLAVHDKNTSQTDDSHTFQVLHENIREQFGLDTIDLNHHDSVCAAFAKVHSYKYLSDPTFNEALEREFKAMAVPDEEQQEAFQALDKIIKEVKDGKNKWWGEKHSGWNPNLDEIIEVSQPEQMKV